MTRGLAGVVVLILQAPTGTAGGQPESLDSPLPDPLPLLEDRPCAEVVDTFDDGQIDLRVTYEYGSGGRLVEARQDDGDDGSVDRVERYRYSPGGVLTLVEGSPSHDAPAEERVVYDYREGWLVGEGRDHDGDGDVDERYLYTYDDAHTLVEERRESEDSPPEQVRFAYDAEGRLVREEVDVGDDGTVDEIVVYHYDEGGVRVVEEDHDADGRADWTVRYIFGPNRRLAVEEWLSDSLDTVQARTYFTYDTSGRLVEVAFDAGDDGEVDVRTRYDFACWDVVTDP